MNSIKKLSDAFTRFPGIGKRTANRFAVYLLHAPETEINNLVQALQDVRKNVVFCSFCFQPFEASNQNLCDVCSDTKKDRRLVCLVEKETDLAVIKETGRYQGIYFILGGTVTLRNSNGEGLRIPQLQERVKNPGKFGLEAQTRFEEIIIALNPTPEGKSTSFLVERALKESEFTGKVTHLATGLPVGGELEYADSETLQGAFEGRK